MGRSLIAVGICLVCSVTACQTQPRNLYVLSNSDSVLPALDEFLNGAGFSVSDGRAKSDTGNVLHVIEAKNHLARIWVQNTVMSGRENKQLCGEHSEPYNDPGQFQITIWPVPVLSDAASISNLESAMIRSLKSLGYNVSYKPAVCSALAHDVR